jgi:hypothetical protein
MWLVATILVIVFLAAIRIVLFGGALFLYTIFAWRPS